MLKNINFISSSGRLCVLRMFIGLSRVIICLWSLVTIIKRLQVKDVTSGIDYNLAAFPLANWPFACNSLQLVCCNYLKFGNSAVNSQRGIVKPPSLHSIIGSSLKRCGVLPKTTGVACYHLCSGMNQSMDASLIRHANLSNLQNLRSVLTNSCICCLFRTTLKPS